MTKNLDELNSTTGIKDEGIDPFDAPTPGASLTDEPGKWAWEQPPKLLIPSEAINFILMRLADDDNFNNLMGLMYGGVTIESITKVLTFNAFSEGLITPDIAEMINPYIFFHIMAIARKTGIKARLLNDPAKSIADVPDIMKDLRPDEYKKLTTAAEDAELAPEITGGFVDMVKGPTEEGPIEEGPTEEGPIEEVPIDEVPIDEAVEEIPEQEQLNLDEEEELI
jgi:hypothetical protein